MLQTPPQDANEPNEWDAYSAEAEDAPARRAALWLVIVGCVEAVVSVLLLGSFLTVALQSVTQLQTTFEEAGYEKDVIAQVLQTRHMMWPMIGMIFVLGLVPAVAYLITSVYVRKRSGRAMSFIITVVLTQAIALGMFVASAVVNALMATNPVALTLFVVFLGTPLAVLIYTMRLLLAARPTAHAAAPRGNHRADRDTQPYEDDA